MGFSKMEKILNKLLLSNQQLYLNNITSKKRYKIEKNPSSWIGVDFSIPQNNEKEKELSKKHSEIRYEANKGFYLKDNDSKNGTYIFAAKQKEIEILEGMNIEISDKIYKISLFKNKEEIHLLVNDSLKYSIPMIKNGRTKLNEEDCEIYENNGKFVFISNQKG